MARTLTFDGAFRVGFALGATIARSAPNSNPPSEEHGSAGCTTASNTINVSQNTVHENHPLASISGLFADDPLWAEYLQAITEIEEEDETP